MATFDITQLNTNRKLQSALIGHDGTNWFVGYVDSAGAIRVVLAAGAQTIGKVDQGNAGVSAWLVTGPLTDTELRASAVPVSGPLTDSQLRASPVSVSGPLTDAQLRATAVPVSAASLPLPSGASTEATLALIKAKTDNLDVALSTRTKPADTQTISGTVTANQGTAGSADWRTDLRRGQTLLFAVIDVSASGDNTIVAADATKKIKVLGYSLVADAAVAARWKSGAGTNISGAMSFAANGGISDGNGNSPATQWLFETAVNQALVLNLGGAVGGRGRLTYFLEV